jgi:hypothetical protein
MTTHAVPSALAALMLSAACGLAAAANTEPMVGEAEMAAKIAHMKAKAKTAGTRNGQKVGTAEELNESQTCGAVDIGNVNTGSRGRQPREVIVVVTGDIINTAECR